MMLIKSTSSYRGLSWLRYPGPWHSNGSPPYRQRLHSQLCSYMYMYIYTVYIKHNYAMCMSVEVPVMNVGSTRRGI